MPRRALSAEQRADAKRLLAAFHRAQAAQPDLTQERLAADLGWKTQGAVSQYLNGRIALNLEALVKFARALGAPPRQISPTLSALLEEGSVGNSELSEVLSVRTEGVPVVAWAEIEEFLASGSIVTGRASAARRQTVACPVGHGPRTFATHLVGASMEPRFRAGDLLFVDPDRPPEHGCYVIARVGNALLFRRLLIDGGEPHFESATPGWPDQVTRVAPSDTILGVVIMRAEEL